jgi:hypothetical protein
MNSAIPTNASTNEAVPSKTIMSLSCEQPGGVEDGRIYPPPCPPAKLTSGDGYRESLTFPKLGEGDKMGVLNNRYGKNARKYVLYGSVLLDH